MNIFQLFLDNWYWFVIPPIIMYLGIFVKIYYETVRKEHTLSSVSKFYTGK